MIVFERKRAPIALFFLILPAAILGMIGLTISTHRFPITLLVLFGAVAATCLFWIKTAIGEIGNVAVEMSQQELRVKRLVGGVTYRWNDIESIKLVDPGPSLSDSGRHDSGRVGIGLYLRVNSQKRGPDAPPDATIITATQDGAGHVIQASERIIAYHRKGGGAKTSTAGGFGKQGRGFKRPSKAAA